MELYVVFNFHEEIENNNNCFGDRFETTCVLCIITHLKPLFHSSFKASSSSLSYFPHVFSLYLSPCSLSLCWSSNCFFFSLLFTLVLVYHFYCICDDYFTDDFNHVIKPINYVTSHSLEICFSFSTKNERKREKLWVFFSIFLFFCFVL